MISSLTLILRRLLKFFVYDWISFVNFNFQVWSASSLAQHNPPTDFLWREQNKWGTGPECTSILCKPNGQVSYSVKESFGRGVVGGTGPECTSILCKVNGQVKWELRYRSSIFWWQHTQFSVKPPKWLNYGCYFPIKLTTISGTQFCECISWDEAWGDSQQASEIIL